jgi:hypothetical protein
MTPPLTDVAPNRRVAVQHPWPPLAEPGSTGGAKRLAGSLTAATLVFLIMMLLRWEIVDAPPCCDQAALFVEASFLYESGFDYFALWRQKAIDDGGRKGYFTCLPPTAIALLRAMGASPRQSFIAYHLYTFACFAAAVVLLYHLLRDDLGPRLSAAVVAAFATAPLVLTQADMLGMDLPATVGVLAAACLLQRERWYAALAATVLAYLLKNSAMVATFAVGLLAAWQLAFNRASYATTSRRRLVITLLASAGLTAAEYGFSVWGGALRTRLLAQPPIGPSIALRCCPDLVLLLFVAIAAALAWLASRAKRAARDRSRPERLFEKVCRALPRNAVWLFGWILIAGNLLAVQRVAFHPRYVLLSLPLLFAVAAIALNALCARKSLLTMSFAALACLNLVNFNGALFPELPPSLRRTSCYVERSHEYLVNHRSIRKAMEAVNKHSRPVPVLSIEFFVYALADPALGYVSEPRHGYTTKEYFYSRQFANALRMLDDRPREVLVVAFHPRFETDPGFCYPPPEDVPGVEVLYADGLDPPLSVYVKRFDTTAATDPYADFYVRLMASGDEGAELAERLRSLGHDDLAKLWRQRRRND